MSETHNGMPSNSVNPLSNRGNAEPSLNNQEGVETRRWPPKTQVMVKAWSRPQTARVAKAIVVRKSCGGSPPCGFDSRLGYLTNVIWVVYEDLCC